MYSMQEFKVKLTDKRQEASGTKTFLFEKPKDFEYIAGQYAYFTLPELKFPDPRGKIRHFTLSSSPTEDYLSITVRMRKESGYKMTLDSLPLGAKIDFRGPTGDFVVDETDTRTQVMIAGGIGITPYRSIIKDVSDRALPNSIHLIYANSRVEEITFRDELTQISESHPNIKVSMTVSNPDENKEPWLGLTGRIDEKLLQSLTSSLQNPVFWLCGPPAMVQALEEVLEQLRIPQERIKIEKFSGY
ncbi:MAG: oxidoreductase FAD/NAD(P)-binding [Microgenomates group bacterium Gr01-1014_5]|nr:MAG: oxidoreductase FAD/NAD(P)-binding [Microgenomates group bacterium Gr01-1014_5]